MLEYLKDMFPCPFKRYHLGSVDSVYLAADIARLHCNRLLRPNCGLDDHTLDSGLSASPVGSQRSV